MDPKANIEEQTTIARAIIEQIDANGGDLGRLGRQAAEEVADLAGQLAEYVLALDEWRRSGGFDPYG